MPDDLNRQMGEVTVSIDYMKQQLDRIANILDRQQTDIDVIKQQMAEIRGAKKMVDWIRSLVAGFIGAIITAIGFVLSLWGRQ